VFFKTKPHCQTTTSFEAASKDRMIQLYKLSNAYSDKQTHHCAVDACLFTQKHFQFLLESVEVC